MKQVAGSSTILGMRLFIAILLQLPYNLAKYSFKILSQKITVTLSSAFWPKVYHWGDYNCDTVFAFIPSVGDMVFGLSIYCIGNNLTVNMVTDKVCVKNPDQFMKILN